MMKQKHNYKVIAIEQTNQSVSLVEAQFPRLRREHGAEELSNCIILLGKEKEGIPVDFLSEVDLCIEIPQFGVLRSLNVQCVAFLSVICSKYCVVYSVSAALAIWEATKQNVGFREGEVKTK